MWLKPFWEYYFKNCSFNESEQENPCPLKAPQNMSKIFSKVKPTMNAVYAFANALQQLKNDECHGQSKCLSIEKHYLGDQFFKNYLSKVELNGSQLFDKNGDLAEPKYAIYQYQRDRNGINKYTRLGNWFQQKLNFDLSKLIWPNEEPPSSSCATVCKEPGQVLRRSTGGVCCSGLCDPCEEYEFVYDTYTCKDCNEFGNDTIGWRPNSDRTGCLPPSHDVFIPVSMFLFAWGITFTIIILFVFIRYRDTPVVKNSSKEHCIVVLVGLALLFLNAPILEASPNTFICVLFRYIAPLGCSMVYSALLVKLNRVYRIFQIKLEVKKTKRNSKKPFHPAYVDVYSTLWITAGFVCVQLLISTMLVVYDPPNAIPIRQNGILKKCSYPPLALAVTHLYNFILIFACTYYAIKTRYLPENFKETKSIGFAMYSTCILWLMSIPLYYGIQHQRYYTKVHVYAITVSISGFIILVCIFMPKAYIILCKPEKNTDEHVKVVQHDSIQKALKLKGKSIPEVPTEGVGNQFICSKCSTTPEDTPQ